jgi:hypothetical protein
MKVFTVRIEVIRTYDIKLGARDREDAIDYGYEWKPTEIQEHGRLVSLETGNAEVIDVEGEDD